MKIEPSNLLHAKNFTYKLLNYRERSTREIEDRLARKGFKKEVIAKAVADLKARGLIDDRRFAKAFTEARLKYRPSGLTLIRRELYRKGIAKDTVSSVVSDFERDYDEYKVAYELANKKAKRFNKKIDTIKAKRRIYDYLLRRRFNKDIIFKVLGEIFKS